MSDTPAAAHLPPVVPCSYHRRSHSLTDFDTTAQLRRAGKEIVYRYCDSFRKHRQGLEEKVNEKREKLKAFVKGGKERMIFRAEQWYGRATRLGKSRLLRLEELPPDRRDTPYIKSGYRFVPTWVDCLVSIFQVHNETGNIWSHLLALFFFFQLAHDTFHGILANAMWSDRLIFGIFYTAVALCLTCSCYYHTFTGHAHTDTVRCAACVDYCGISALITASVQSVVWFGFYEDDVFRTVYTLILAVMGIVGITIPFFSWFSHEGYRNFRISIFISMAFTSIIPVCHAIILRGWIPTWNFFYPEAMSNLTYLVGVVFFLYHIPECWFPGWFDYIGGSHQLWHLFVIYGILGHHQACLHMYEHRYVYGGMSVGTNVEGMMTGKMIYDKIGLLSRVIS